MPEANDKEPFQKGFGKFFKEHWLPFLLYLIGIIGFFCTASYNIGYVVSQIENPKPKAVPEYNKDSAENVYLRKENQRLKAEKEDAENRKEEIENIVIYRMEAKRNEQ